MLPGNGAKKSTSPTTARAGDHNSTTQCGSGVSIRMSKKQKLIFSTIKLSQVLVDYALDHLIDWWRLI
jgi:hypothetical protein